MVPKGSALTPWAALTCTHQSRLSESAAFFPSPDVNVLAHVLTPLASQHPQCMPSHSLVFTVTIWQDDAVNYRLIHDPARAAFLH